MAILHFLTHTLTTSRPPAPLLPKGIRKRKGERSGSIGSIDSGKSSSEGPGPWDAASSSRERAVGDSIYHICASAFPHPTRLSS